MSRYALYLLVIFALLPSFAHCQGKMQYNINVNNGLPSNHVYWVNIDRYGYLWISTDNGILKYNGYQFKLFNLLDGMANCDIWGGMEDKKGRMWLYSISKDIGYIYKDKYKKAFLKDTFQRMYPRQIREDSLGIIFLNPSRKDQAIFTLCQERNDTIYDCRTDTIKWKDSNGKSLAGKEFINYKNELINASDDYVMKCDLSHNPPLITILCKVPKGFFSKKNQSFLTIFESYLVSCNENIHILNYETGFQKNILTKNTKEHFITGAEANGCLYIHSNKATYKFNNKMDLVKKVPYEDLLKDKKGNGSNTVFAFENKFWKKIIGTTDNGLYIDFKELNHFQLVKSYDLAGYKYVGCTIDSTCFWWNKSKLILACIQKDGRIIYHKQNAFYNIIKIVPYDENRSLLLANNNTYWLNNYTKAIVPIFTGIKHFIFESKSSQSENLYDSNAYTCRDAIINKDKKIYIIKYTPFINILRFNHDTVFITGIGYDRYANITSDSIHNLFWLHTDNNIILLRQGNNKCSLLKNIPDSLHIRNIEKIVVDNNYGNVFLKDYNKLFLFNYNSGVYKELFKNFRLDNSLVRLYNKTLIVASRFGVLFSKINGLGNISSPILYANIRGIAYNYIIDMQVVNNQVMLNTDKGLYKVSIPSNNETYKSKNNDAYQLHKFILIYSDTTIGIKNNDTVLIKPKDNVLQFDLINPYGEGQLKYNYWIKDMDTVWHRLNSNELHLPKLSPDKYYTVSIKAYDNVWKSDKMNIHLFVIPYWWQTRGGKNVIIISILFLTIMFLYVVIIITKSIVTRNNLKKNLQLELELKSIHAQINPHFIFNTLSAALSFINDKKLDEAYWHISKFSHLLRAYLKSSRNKFITIAEEINNLKNYIDLQRTRFDYKFDYKIIVDDIINIHKTNIPSLLLQPIVENAIVHGLFHKENDGFLEIEFKIDDNDLVCIINDNGIGREESKIIEDNNKIKRQSYGDQLIMDLVRIFRRYEKMSIEIDYFDKIPPETGVVVTLRIKNKHHGKRIQLHNS